MPPTNQHKSFVALVLAILVLFQASGCQTLRARNPAFEADLPPELMVGVEGNKVGMPPYIIEPPDVLLIDAIKVVPKAPYRLQALDSVIIDVLGTLPDQPINDIYTIEATGKINLGPSYGTIKAEGLSVEQLQKAIEAKLSETLRDPIVSLSLGQTTGTQQIAGPHLINPDGMVSLGTYGRVYVAGMTFEEAEASIEEHLEKYLESPDVLVDISTYASKGYYIITQGAGTGDRVVRNTFNGGETVLDAIAGQGGLSSVSTQEMWIARPAADKLGYEQILPVDWDSITRGGQMATNWQIMPGDRLYIAEDPLQRFDFNLNRLVRPFDTVSGSVLLISSTIRSLSQSFSRSNNNNNGGGGNF